MSTAKPTGIKVPSRIGKPPGSTAPKTNPSTGRNLPMCCNLLLLEHEAMQCLPLNVKV